MELMLDTLIFAYMAAFLAGFVDAIVGGGGLIQLPALLVIFPQAAIAPLLGTNKLSSIAGTISAILTYTKKVSLPWRLILPASVIAFVTSGLGAGLATVFPPAHLKPIILILLVLVFLYTLFRPRLGTDLSVELHPESSKRLNLASGAIGAYDGFLGPGTGNFLIFSLARWIRMPFLLASASAKIINFATNIAAILLFASTGNIIFKVALPMAGANLLGGYLGAKMAIVKGNKFIRWLFLIVVAGLISKIGFSL